MPSSQRMQWPYPTENQNPWYDPFEDFVVAMDASGYAAREDRNLVLSDGGTVTWTATSGTVAWGDTIRIISPVTGFQLRILAGSAALDEGQVLYAVLTRAPTKHLTVTAVVANQVPSSDGAFLLAVRVEDRLYWRNGLVMDGGDSVLGLGAKQGGGGGGTLEVEDEGVSVEPACTNMDFVGAGVTATQTAAGEVRVSIPGTDANAIHDNVAGEIAAIAAKAVPVAGDLIVIEDSAAANAKKSVQLGNIPATDANAIHDNVPAEISAIANKAAPTTADYLLIEDAAAADAKKHITLGSLPGGVDPAAIHDNVSAEISAIPNKAAPTVSDYLLIEDAAAADAKKRITIGSLPIGATDIRTAAIVVGNTPNGDAPSVCDFLDSGDGVALQAALAAAGAGADVYIRPGTYDLGTGPAVPPLTIPPSARVRGAGRYHTTVRTVSAGDQGAFVLGAGSILEDVGIEVALPLGPGLGSTAVVALLGNYGQCQRVGIDFLGAWTPAEAAFTVLRSCYEVGSAAATVDGCQLVGCTAGEASLIPSLLNLGLVPGNELVVFSVQTGPGSSFISALIKRCRALGGDWGGAAYRPVRVLDSTFEEMYELGFLLSGAPADSSEIGDCFFISNFGAAGNERGILLDTVQSASIVDNYIAVDTPVVGQEAIELVGSDWNTVRGNRGVGGLIGAVRLDATSDDNEVLGNNFRGSAYTDLGARNDLAHNK